MPILIIALIWLIASLLFEPGAFLVHHWVATLIGLGTFVGLIILWGVIYEYWEQIKASAVGELVKLAVDEIGRFALESTVVQGHKAATKQMRQERERATSSMDRIVVKGGRHLKGYHRDGRR